MSVLIQKLCEESASVSISLADIALAVQDITAVRLFICALIEKRVKVKRFCVGLGLGNF